jgi:hypothetical protein
LSHGQADRTEKKSGRYNGPIDSDSHDNLLCRHNILQRGWEATTLMRKIAVHLTQINAVSP